MKCAVPRWMTFNVVFKSWEMLWLVQNTLGKLWCVDTVQLCLICGITPDVCLTKALRSNLLDKNIQEMTKKTSQVINRGFGHPNSLDSPVSNHNSMILTKWKWIFVLFIVKFPWGPKQRETCQESWRIALSNCPQSSSDNFNKILEFWLR